MTCRPVPPTPAGESPVGETPLLAGTIALLHRIGELFSILSKPLDYIAIAFHYILMPFLIVSSAVDFVADGLGFALRLVWVPSSWLSRYLGSPDPTVLALILLTLILRIISLPILKRGTLKRAREVLIRSEWEAIKDKYRGLTSKEDRKAMTNETMDLYKRFAYNPFAGVFILVLTVVLLSAAWRLVYGLTVTSQNGTFAPRHLDGNSAIYVHLSRVSQLRAWGMDMCLSIFQVGYCSDLIPYVVLLVLTTLAGMLLSFPGKAGLVTGKTMKTVFAVMIFLPLLTFPMLLVSVRLIDYVYLNWQSRYLRRLRLLEEVRLATEH